jgi:hypothetical protein
MLYFGRKFGTEKLFDVITAFGGEQDAAKLLIEILGKMMEITNADAGMLHMVEDGTLHFRIKKNNSFGVYPSPETESVIICGEFSESTILLALSNIKAFDILRGMFAEGNLYKEPADIFTGSDIWGKKEYA